MKKHDVELLGEYLRSRAPSAQEQQSVLKRVRQRLQAGEPPTRLASAKPRVMLYVLTGAIAAAMIVMIINVRSVRNASPARVGTSEGVIERVPEKADEPKRPGENLEWDEVIRTGPKSRAVLTLNDGSQIEMRSNSTLVLEKASDGVRIRLDNGGVFITAANQPGGHLYVQTKDVTVSVIGTVFLVNAEEAGSRVVVVEGEVHVQQGEKTSRLFPGQQVTTNPLMAEHSVVEQLAWSHSFEPYRESLQQPKRLEFEAAIIRPLPPGPSRFASRPRCRGIDGELRPAGPTAPMIPLGRCVVETAILGAFLEAAYDSDAVRISGLPAMVQQPSFSLEAKAEDPSKTTREELRQMLQNLVVKHFDLKVHRETRELDGYVLTIGKDGVKFKETSEDEDLPVWEFNGEPRLAAPEMILPVIVKGNFRMPVFVNALSGQARMPIVDKTGLQNLYGLRFAIDLLLGSRGGGGQRGGGLRGGTEPAPPQQFDPPLAEALEKQLGLHLEKVKVPVDYLVVDSYDIPKN
jgi:uncharacterized protein (TIGR03435 family)